MKQYTDAEKAAYYAEKAAKFQARGQAPAVAANAPKTQSAPTSKELSKEERKLARMTGRAYKLGQKGRKIKFRSEARRQEFREGYRSTDVSRYDKLRGKGKK